MLRVSLIAGAGLTAVLVIKHPSEDPTWLYLNNYLSTGIDQDPTPELQLACKVP